MESVKRKQVRILVFYLSGMLVICGFIVDRFLTAKH